MEPHPFTIVIDYGLEFIYIDDLVNVYTLNKFFKSRLDEKYMLDRMKAYAQLVKYNPMYIQVNVLAKLEVNPTFSCMRYLYAQNFIGLKCLKLNSLTKCVKEAAQRGDGRIIDLALEKGFERLKYIAKYAARGGQKDLLNWLSGEFGIDLDDYKIAKEAARGGFLYDINPTKSQRLKICLSAARGGQDKNFSVFSKGCSFTLGEKYILALKAARGGNLDLFNSII